MLNGDFLISLIVVICLIYLLYICYCKYLENKQIYLKILTIFLMIEVVRRTFIYGKINSRLISGISLIQLILLLTSTIVYGVMYFKNNLS
ncbi:hypothetical protein [Clostridium sp. LIBA-8841]|uniref:hypothetical protein n=1 Tax=Clostridium sp. LIBA-8841 TaxID=2987530 RepID=UPI002AC477B4|nr:hypothetical protein [Clostridium sp. LIBA-8841]MDZ5252537.1 hypothetical protein [Clostridium sp. LIBA-8841]